MNFCSGDTTATYKLSAVYPYEFKEDLIVRLDLNSSEKVDFCSGDSAVTYKLSDVSLEYDAIFDECVDIIPCIYQGNIHPLTDAI